MSAFESFRQIDQFRPGPRRCEVAQGPDRLVPHAGLRIPAGPKNRKRLLSRQAPSAPARSRGR